MLLPVFYVLILTQSNGRVGVGSTGSSGVSVGVGSKVLVGAGSSMVGVGV